MTKSRADGVAWEWPPQATVADMTRMVAFLLFAGRRKDALCLVLALAGEVAEAHKFNNIPEA